MPETPEQILAHRDQLKTENDRLNPAHDALQQQVASLTELLGAANSLREDLAAKLATEQAARKAVEDANAQLQADLAKAKAAHAIDNEAAAKAVQTVQAESARLKQIHDARAAVHSTVLKMLLDEAQKA